MKTARIMALALSSCALASLLNGCGGECLRDSDCNTRLVCSAGSCVVGRAGGLDGGVSPSPSGGGSGGGGSGGAGGSAGMGGSGGAAGNAGVGGTDGVGGSGGASGAAGQGGSAGVGGSAGAGGSAGTGSTGTVNDLDAGSDGGVSADAQ